MNLWAAGGDPRRDPSAGAVVNIHSLKAKLDQAAVRALAHSIIDTASHGALAACATFMCVWIICLVLGVLWFKVFLY